ncbi:MAG TPA: serine/threonine-protein kinase [Casimicrobiaceae bacterium]|nr:serine/threonine-protein kinase [Casimicrobiaceae bacterium]
MLKVEKVGRYEVIDTLARGGMGVVYKARDPLIDRVVAVKTLGLGLSPIEAEAFRKRFAREAKSAGMLSHPNIVTIHDMGESDDGAYIAMEFLEGHSLREVLDSGVVLSPARVASIGVAVASGLAFAHRHDVVHCDIKPANIMVLASGGVKITDFGIARLPTGSRTFAGNVLGSPRYISPEQIVGRPIDTRSDVFSLGAVLYEMLTGVAPFAGESIDEILFQVINDKPLPPSKRNRSIPAEFDAIVARAMAKNPDDRYARASDLAAALSPLSESPQPIIAALPPIAATRPKTDSGATTLSMPMQAGSPRDSRMWMRYGIAATALLFVVIVAAMLPATHERKSLVTTNANAVNAEPAPRQTVSPLPRVLPPIDSAATSPPSRDGDDVRSSASVVGAVPDNARMVVTGGNVARLAFAVAPWGEVFVDGKKRGVTPPLTEIKLPPGRYEVEIRNTSFPVHRETVELFADAPLRIRHRFE